MNIVVLSKSEVPIYEQIYNQISSQIMNGELEADACLPSIRSVARELEVSIITIKKAYELLEAGDFIYTRAGKGCFVSPHPKNQLENRRLEIAEDKLRKDVAYYRELGLGEEELVALVRKCFR